VEIVAQNLNKKTKIWLIFMKLGALTCHQMYERSFNYKGYQFPVCARCTGIFVGNIIGVFLYIINIKISIIAGLTLILIMAIDGLIQLFKIKASTNKRRFITGILAGIGYICILVNIFFYLWHL
jgi:Predicted membrane protein